MIELAALPDEIGTSRLLTSEDRTLLTDASMKWRHLQTEHFVIHYNRRMFANKVARFGESFYHIISSDFPQWHDRQSPNHSHIFVISDSKTWNKILNANPTVERWAASFVHGQVMYLQEIGQQTSDKMDIFAHEMTHLVLNRHITKRVPLWLNEGLAEYYGEFAYRASKGMGQSKKQAFPPLKNAYPLNDLLNATQYPASPEEVTRFYATAKYLVGFLRLKQPAEKWMAFMTHLSDGQSIQTDLLLSTFGWPDVATLEKQFLRFSR